MKNDNERDFEEDVKINKFHLEEMCEKHAGLYYYYARRLADAKNNVNKLDNSLTLQLGKEELRIRKNWDDTKYGKQTENGIKTLLLSCCIEERRELEEAQADVNIYAAAVSAMEHRKTMLDNEVTLLVKGFYAAPNGGKREGITEATGKELTRKLNKKRKESNDEEE